jgi:glutathione S-transferase
MSGCPGDGKAAAAGVRGILLAGRAVPCDGSSSMAEIILHQYDRSPFARKIRAAFGIKGVSWRAADVAPLPPRPALSLLAGGYRRIPVLQLGADIFCDSNLIVRVLETLVPSPSLTPPGDTLSVPVSQWFEPRLFSAFSVLRFRRREDFQGIFASPEEAAAFSRDRAAFMLPMMDISKNAENAPTALAHVESVASYIEATLEHSGPFLQGAVPSHADLSAWHPFCWFKGSSAQRELLADHPRLWAWVDRIEAFGEGQRSPIELDQTLAIARQAEPRFCFEDARPSPIDPAQGTRVSVAPIDYGIDPVIGELVSIGREHVSVRRATPETGEVVVHFPRWGYRVLPA